MNAIPHVATTGIHASQKHGNSGVFFRAGEDDPKIFLSAPEMQILDDEKHRDGQSDLTSAGSNYGLHPARRGIVKSAGEWSDSHPRRGRSSDPVAERH